MEKLSLQIGQTVLLQPVNLFVTYKTDGSKRYVQVMGDDPLRLQLSLHHLEQLQKACSLDNTLEYPLGPEESKGQDLRVSLSVQETTLLLAEQNVPVVMLRVEHLESTGLQNRNRKLFESKASVSLQWWSLSLQRYQSLLEPVQIENVCSSVLQSRHDT